MQALTVCFGHYKKEARVEAKSLFRQCWCFSPTFIGKSILLLKTMALGTIRILLLPLCWYADRSSFIFDLHCCLTVGL